MHARADSPRVAVTTVSGDVDLAGAMPSLDVETVNGDIALPAAGTDLRLQTVSGNLRVGGGALRDADVGSVSALCRSLPRPRVGAVGTSDRRCQSDPSRCSG